MKVVFLDIDGVLNSLQWFKAGHGHDRGFGHLDPAACARVQRICDQTGAVICISSTWRKIHKLPKLKEWLRKKGLTAKIVGITPEIPLHGAQRGDEICMWLKRHPEVKDYVVLDDDSDMRGVSHKFVKTMFYEGGISDDNVVEAIRILLGE